MTTVVAHYHGRGGARLRMARPRIESSAWETDHRSGIRDWLVIANRLAALFSPARFLFALIIALALVLLTHWLANHFLPEVRPARKDKQERALRLVVQHQPAPRKQRPETKPALPEKPKPTMPPMQPATEKPKPRPKPVALIKPEPRARPEPEAVAQAKPVPPARPAPKRPIDLEASLNTEKDFQLPPKVSSRRQRQAAVRSSYGRENAPDDGTALRKHRRPSPSRPVVQSSPAAIPMHDAPAGDAMDAEAYALRRQQNSQPEDEKTQLDQIEAGLARDLAADPYPEIEPGADDAYRPISAADRQRDYNQDQEIVLAIQETAPDEYPGMRTAREKPVPRTPQGGRGKPTEKGQSDINFAESGVSLIQLKACGPVEKTIKFQLAELVKQSGYRRECRDETGIYKFYWPSERFTIQHFNVIIYTSRGRIATDRCEELTNACECLENN